MKAVAPSTPFAQPPAKRFSWALAVTTFLSIAVAVVSYRYLVGVEAPPSIHANAMRDPWLLIHVAGAATALLVGPIQFFPRVRADHPQLHRWTGRVYVLGCIVGGVSGLFLSAGASTGPVSVAGFGLLAIAWLFTTIVAWQRAMQGRIECHKSWMTRSFALTLAAVTLRLYLPISAALPFPEEMSYRAISFLCWVPNLLLAENFLRRRTRPAVPLRA